MDHSSLLPLFLSPSLSLTPSSLIHFSQIPEARGLLSHALCILSSLRVCHAQLVELDQRGERGREQWSIIMSQVEGWQVIVYISALKFLYEIEEFGDESIHRFGYPFSKRCGLGEMSTYDNMYTHLENCQFMDFVYTYCSIFYFSTMFIVLVMTCFMISFMLWCAVVCGWV